MKLATFAPTFIPADPCEPRRQRLLDAAPRRIQEVASVLSQEILIIDSALRERDPVAALRSALPALSGIEPGKPVAIADYVQIGGFGVPTLAAERAAPNAWAHETTLIRNIAELITLLAVARHSSPLTIVNSVCSFIDCLAADVHRKRLRETCTHYELAKAAFRDKARLEHVEVWYPPT